jgi:hypothetical protein
MRSRMAVVVSIPWIAIAATSCVDQNPLAPSVVRHIQPITLAAPTTPTTREPEQRPAFVFRPAR